MLGHMRKEHSDYPADECAHGLLKRYLLSRPWCAIPQEEANNVKDEI